MLSQSFFLLNSEVRNFIKLLLGSITDSRYCFFELFVMSIHSYFYLHHFLFFLFPFLFISFHFPLDHVLYLQVESHSIVMNRIQDHRLTRSLSNIFMDVHLDFLNLFFNVVLNDFNPLDDNIFKYSLSLFNINIILKVFIT